MSEILETIEYKGLTIEIYPDDNAENPIKEWDMVGEFCCWHRRYDLGNSKQFGNRLGEPEEARACAKQTGSLLFDLYMYEHSGIVLSLSNSSYPFNDRWDSGQLGYVLVDREQALKEFGKKRLSKALKQRIAQIVEGEVETYNQYLSGDIYGYIVRSKDGEDIDSCWGFYGLDAVEKEAKSIVDCKVKELVKKHFEQLKHWIRNRVPFGYRTSAPLYS